jgi:predicted PurR-regulated permease PerM
MMFRHNFELTFTALKRWFIAQCYDAVIVGLLWLAVLWYLHVPLAPFWAFLGGLFQFVPNFGPVLALPGPALAILFSGAEWERFAGLLIAYAAIAVVDGLFLQPYLMHRQNRVPMWASILAPVALGIIIPFWGVLLAPPLLAVIYAHVRRKQRQEEVVRSGQAIILPPEKPAKRRNTRMAPVVDPEPEAGDPGGEHRNR